jgi:transcriptional regulator with XRE-family HTH domain
MPSSIHNPADFGSALHRARKARALRLEDVALTAGVGIRFVSELERGKATARLAETLRVAEALGVSVVLEDPLEQPDAQ